jgi:hypothetical protein
MGKVWGIDGRLIPLHCVGLMLWLFFILCCGHNWKFVVRRDNAGMNLKSCDGIITKTTVAHESKNLEDSNPKLCLRNQNFRLLFK